LHPRTTQYMGQREYVRKYGDGLRSAASGAVASLALALAGGRLREQ
jgi:hypothetical protein